MPLATGDFIRLAIDIKTFDNEFAQLVYHRKITSGAGIDEGAFLVAETTLIENAFANIVGMIHTGSTWETVTGWVRNIPLHQWDGIGTGTLTSLDGTSTADPAPHGVAAVVHFLTPVLRRAMRKFIPMVTESFIDGSGFTATAIANLLLWALDWDDENLAGGGTAALATFNDDDTSPLYETGEVYGDVIVLDQTPGYQRRRKPGVGA